MQADDLADFIETADQYLDLIFGVMYTAVSCLYLAPMTLSSRTVERVAS